jgi:hypothetical protein
MYSSLGQPSVIDALPGSGAPFPKVGQKAGTDTLGVSS